MADDDTESVGIPTKYNPTTIGKLIEAFHSDYTIEQACRYADIHRDTYYAWLKTHDGFADKMDDAQNKLLEKAGEVVAKNINDGDANLAFKYKQARDPRFKSKVEVSINPEEQALEDIIKDTTNDTNNLPDDSPKAQAGDRSQSPPVD